mmetsp:Transcript_44575/g.110917  ORF Transcript_44575/g.110917 Transcript_44575/m.110917 type:complete len:90 (+) Transcript_44575:323-592(+)
MKVPSEKEILQAIANERTPVGSQIVEYRALVRRVDLSRQHNRSVYEPVTTGEPRTWCALVPCAEYEIVDSVGWTGFNENTDGPQQMDEC